MFKSCGKCNNGKITIRSKNGNTWKYCDCYKTYIHNMRIYSKMKSSGLNDIVVKSFDDYVGTDENKNIPKMKKFVDEFSNKFHDKHLFIYGDNGTQKSTMAKVLLYKLMLKGKKVLYIMADDYFNLFSDINPDEFVEDKISDFYDADCVVIDEFDPSKFRVYTNAMTQLKVGISPLKKRLECLRKSTIFISNRTLDELKSGHIITDRHQSESTKNVINEFSYIYGDFLKRELIPLIFEDKYCENVKRDFSSIWDD